jgi:hypothetical protein
MLYEISIIIIPSYCQSNSPIFIVLTYYMGNMFRLIIESYSDPYIQIQILGYCNCVIGLQWNYDNQGSVFVYKGLKMPL